jgi:hypothetical protein
VAEPSRRTHQAPNPGVVALVFMALFIAGLSFVVSFDPATPHYPGPWEAAEAIAAYFRGQPRDVLLCAAFQFGSAIPLGIFTATMVSRLRFHGVRAAGVDIAFFGGLMAAFDVAVSSLGLWVMSYPGIADEGPVLRALYYFVFAVGGAGYSVPLGLLIAGLAVTSAFTGLLPRWVAYAGLVLAACGLASFVSLLVPGALFLVPLTRFPGFIWLAIAGFMLPKAVQSKAVRASSLAGAPVATAS